MIHLRIFLPVFFLLYFLLTFLMYAPKRKDKPPKLKTVTLLNNLIWLLVIALTTIFSLFPEIYHQYVVPFEALKTHTLSWVAIGIMTVAFMIVFSAKNYQRLSRGSERRGWLLLTKGIYSKNKKPAASGAINHADRLFSLYSQHLFRYYIITWSLYRICPGWTGRKGDGECFLEKITEHTRAK